MIGVEVLHNKDIAPNGNLKKSTLARTKTLESMGWEMIQLKWDEFTKMPIGQQHKFFNRKLLDFWNSQEEKKVQRDYQESLDVLKLAKVRQFEFMHFDDVDEFIEEMRPTQEELEAVIQGIPVEVKVR